ncbi:hypothetical protein IP91_01376 [Pseudoduganella lurida]|uniref:Uncharacterized protein n=1 Tax=Pseudoduganella lurida TaxID=1036180 RepID=A0A562REB4_9BURK|nr:hypothetical protein [Pseudoduganella lurida]TWI67263.1 hypothetical protein IP91_01376 [Pseudoduganella lurida]
MGDGFFVKLWRGTAPLVLWAAHFFFCYLYSAAQCGRGTWLVLGIATVLALAAALWLLWRACRREGTASEGMLPLAEGASALLAVIGIGWGALPLVLLEHC